jgi:hypothetical protein
MIPPRISRASGISVAGNLRLLGWLGLPRLTAGPLPPPTPLPEEATGTLTRVEYPTEVHFFTPTGALVKIVPKIRKPALRRYLRRVPL